MTQHEWAHAISIALGKKKASIINLPRFLGAAAAAGGEVASRVTRKAVVFGWDKWREARAGSWVADTAAAKQVLGFEAMIDHAMGFAETAAWYRAQGWLPGG